MIGILYLRQEAFGPLVPSARSCRCILYANREAASSVPWILPYSPETLPVIGYIVVWHPAHQNISCLTCPRLEEAQSIEQAATAIGLANINDSGWIRTAR